MSLDCCNSDICDTILAEDAYLLLACVVGRLKHVVATIGTLCSDRHVFNRSLGQFTAVQAIMFEAEARLYTLESIVYYIAGMLEMHRVSQVRFESQLALAYGSNLALDCLTQLEQVCGADHRFRLPTNHSTPIQCHIAELKRDVQSFQFILGDKELLKNSLKTQIVQMLESQEARKDYGIISRSDKHRNMFLSSRTSTLSKLRNLSQGFHIRTLESQRANRVFPYRLFEQLHPNLHHPAVQTETAAYAFNTATRLLLWGGYNVLVKAEKSQADRDRMERHHWISFDPVLQSAFNVMASCAVLSRSSRSKSLGLKHCDDEIRIAALVCQALCTDVDSLLAPMHEAPAIRMVPKSKFDINHPNMYPQHPLDAS